jgi:branched-chain amino acid aminotransferase
VTPTVIVAVSPMPSFPGELYARGLVVHVASGRRNERAMQAGLKTLGYTEAVLAYLEAQRAGADDALFLDTEQHCSEATSSNLFIWTGTVLRTPPVTCGALPGITRAAVLELAAAAGMAVEERAFGLDELLGAGEAFLTSSLRGIAPLVGVGELAIGAGRPGPVARRIAAAHQDLVARECGG